jgi:hypothetical protein
MRGNAHDTLEQVRSKLKELQTDVAKAKKVIIIGGGPVGLEYAGVSLKLDMRKLARILANQTQEIRAQFPVTQITVLHSLAKPLNPTDPSKAAKSNIEGTPHAWQVPYNNPKLSNSLETILPQLKIEFIGNAKVPIPTTGSEVKEGEWDGSFGLQNGLKKIALPNGEIVEGDFFFLGLGNQSNAGFVEKADSGAVVNGLVRVDDYLKVRPKSANPWRYQTIGADMPGGIV